MLNPPKIHFIGNATACAKWLPFAQKKMQYLMTVYQGAYFHKKFKVPGATIWLDNDGYIRRILIQAGIDGYEFATGFRTGPDILFTFAYHVFDDYLFTRSKLTGEEVSPFKSTGGKINPDTETYQNARDYQVFGGTYDDETNAELSKRSDWFYVPQSLDMDELKENGYRQCPHMVTFNTLEVRYQNYFASPLFQGFGRINYYGPAFLQKRGRKPKRLSSGETGGDPVFFGASAVTKDGFAIFASIGGYDFKFEVLHINSGTRINFQADKPSWVSGDQIATWYFSPDATKAVSIQSRYTELGEEIRQGICELKFTPSYENEVLTCEVEAGIEIYPDEGILPLAVDYDLYDASVIRALLVKNYLSEWLDDPDGGADIRAILGVGEFVTIDSSGVVSSPNHKILLYHGPFVNSADEIEEFDQVEDEYGYFLGTLYSGSDHPGWVENYQYHWLMTNIQAIDLRANAYAAITCFSSRESAGLDDDFYFYKEHRIWGEKKESSYYADKPFPQSIPDISDQTIPSGYTEYNRTHPFWIKGVAWAEWLVGGVGNIFRDSHVALTFKSFVFHPTELKSFGFAIHPDKSYALFGIETGFRFNTGYGSGLPNEDHIKFSPDGFIHDHIEFVSADGEIITSTHVEQFNKARNTEYENDGTFPALTVTNGTWIL